MKVICHHVPLKSQTVTIKKNLKKNQRMVGKWVQMIEKRKNREDDDTKSKRPEKTVL